MEGNGNAVPAGRRRFRDRLFEDPPEFVQALHLDVEVRRLRARVAELEARETADQQRPVR